MNDSDLQCGTIILLPCVGRLMRTRCVANFVQNASRALPTLKFWVDLNAKSHVRRTFRDHAPEISILTRRSTSETLFTARRISARRMLTAGRNSVMRIHLPGLPASLSHACPIRNGIWPEASSGKRGGIFNLERLGFNPGELLDRICRSVEFHNIISSFS